MESNAEKVYYDGQKERDFSVIYVWNTQNGEKREYYVITCIFLKDLCYIQRQCFQIKNKEVVLIKY